MEYSTLLEAMEAATNAELPCATLSTGKSTTYTVDRVEGKSVVRPPFFVVDCVEDAVEPIQRLLITWVAPTQREDGTPLSPSEIEKYQLEVDGQVTDLGTATKAEVAMGPTYRLRTVANGKFSKWVTVDYDE